MLRLRRPLVIVPFAVTFATASGDRPAGSGPTDPSGVEVGGKANMMPFVVRKAERRDVESLGRLGVILMQTHYAFDPRRFLEPGQGAESGYASFLGRALDSAKDCVFVAEQDGAIVGYVYGALEPMSWKELRGPAGFIHDVVVAEEARRSGMGTRLMEAAIEWLREHGAPRVILWTAAPNAAAHALFRRLGFRDTAMEMTMELERGGAPS